MNQVKYLMTGSDKGWFGRKHLILFPENLNVRSSVNIRGQQCTDPLTS